MHMHIIFAATILKMETSSILCAASFDLETTKVVY
jgi:hypothetical protein